MLDAAGYSGEERDPFVENAWRLRGGGRIRGERYPRADAEDSGRMRHHRVYSREAD